MNNYKLIKVRRNCFKSTINIHLLNFLKKWVVNFGNKNQRIITVRTRFWFSTISQFFQSNSVVQCECVLALQKLFYFRYGQSLHSHYCDFENVNLSFVCWCYFQDTNNHQTHRLLHRFGGLRLFRSPFLKNKSKKRGFQQKETKIQNQE